jgi:hypothetical protein
MYGSVLNDRCKVIRDGTYRIEKSRHNVDGSCGIYIRILSLSYMHKVVHAICYLYSYKLFRPAGSYKLRDTRYKLLTRLLVSC